MNPSSYTSIRKILRYRTPEGRKPFGEWLSALKDRGGCARILARLDRLLFGPGYRVYFGRDGEAIVVLLCGGDKSSQTADIQRAQEYWKDYLRRK